LHRAPARHVPHASKLIEALLSPEAFDHPADDIELVETHISWVILAGDFVYKIKKPVVLDFLDFGTLDRRRHFCEEEIRLNRPSAPEIYLDVVPIGMVDGQPKFGADGDPVEYAVRMRRFDQALRLDAQLEQQALSVQDMKELGQTVATRHRSAAHVEVDRRERVLRLTREFMEDNFVALEGFVDQHILRRLIDWTRSELQRREALIAQRFDDGYVRDCHGDLHLGNLVRLPGGITTFDCIEFNPDLRQIDVMCDIAFLVMDLVARERHDLAAHFINRYLEATGDYDGIAVLSLFFVYRCLVRAKVAAIRSTEREAVDEAAADLEEANFYCDMALRQSRERQPILVLMHGLSGSGKTWVSGMLMAAMPAIRIRSDIERKRLFGLAETASSGSAVGEGIYTRDASDRIYSRLFDCAEAVLASGHHVILDAAFLDGDSRIAGLDVARGLAAPAVIVDVVAPEPVLRQRLAERSEDRSDPSEAGLAVLDAQLESANPLSAEERRISVTCDNSVSIDIDELVKKVRDSAHIPGAGP
jgi:aminoglycoside phosphotransferase family enzyme/predicted kinase